MLKIAVSILARYILFCLLFIIIVLPWFDIERDKAWYKVVAIYSPVIVLCAVVSAILDFFLESSLYINLFIEPFLTSFIPILLAYWNYTANENTIDWIGNLWLLPMAALYSGGLFVVLFMKNLVRTVKNY